MKIKTSSFVLLTVGAAVLCCSGCTDSAPDNSGQPWTKPAKWENRSPMLENIKL